jgi:hypothetical protein
MDTWSIPLKGGKNFGRAADRILTFFTRIRHPMSWQADLPRMDAVAADCKRAFARVDGDQNIWNFENLGRIFGRDAKGLPSDFQSLLGFLLVNGDDFF